jgi:3-oxoacyl-[acyl-carrier protein] reductase
MKLSGKVVLITGGATGIGRAASELFAREGAAVAVNFNRSRDAAEGLVAAIREAGGRAIAVGADVSEAGAVDRMMGTVEREFGRLDYLVNNAGWTARVPHEKLEEMSEEIWDRTLDTNLRGPFYCIRRAAPLLRLQEGAAVVNVASMAAVSGRGSSVAYVASKAGLVGITRSLARALGPGIRVNAVAPGLIRTGFARWTEEHCAAAEAVTPARRLATAEDIAEAILFLAGSRAMTGETIYLDGGLTTLGPS